MTDRSRTDPTATTGHDQPTEEKPTGTDRERFPGKSANGTDTKPSSEIAAEEEKRQLETGEENPG